MCLSNCNSQEGWLHKFRDYKDCFKGMDPNGKITLYGSKTGESVAGNSRDNIAQKIATDSKIQVIAPIDHVSPSGIQLSDSANFEIYQKNNSGDKLFKSFQPVFDKCTNIANPLHPREKEAIEVVKKEITENSQIIHPDDLETYLLEMCHDNPKEKFLYLSMESDWNGALKPEHKKKVIEKISSHYDLKFKVVKSYNEICKEIEQAAKIGEIVHLVIDGHGSIGSIDISGKDQMHLNPLSYNYKDYSCFKNLSPSTKITLLTCSTGKPNAHGNVNDNLANLIAKKTGKVVISPIDLIKATEIKIESIDDFYVFHTDKKNGNLFKKFNPERVDDNK